MHKRKKGLEIRAVSRENEEVDAKKQSDKKKLKERSWWRERWKTKDGSRREERVGWR